MKKENKRMIDEALTPEVRQFLPEMIERMSEVRKVNLLEKNFNAEKDRTEKFEQLQQNEIELLRREL